MKSIIIYPDNSGCVDGQFLGRDDTRKLRVDYNLPERRIGQDTRYVGDGIEILVFATKPWGTGCHRKFAH